METVRVTKEEWLRAGVHFVRIDSTMYDYDMPLRNEFDTDGPDSEYILVLDGNFPVSTCRVHVLDGETAQLERVATVRAYQGKGAGRTAVYGAEEWLRERGVKKVKIHSRESAVGFYERCGYSVDYSEAEGEGDFRLFWAVKEL